MIIPSSILALLQKLIHLCHRQAIHSLSSILELFSMLFKRTRTRQSTLGRGFPEVDPKYREVLGVPSSSTITDEDVLETSSLIHREWDAVLAYASAPGPASQALIRGQAPLGDYDNSHTSYPPQEPASSEGQGQTDLTSQGRLSLPMDDFRREPAGVGPQSARMIVSPQGTPQKHITINPSSRPRYERNIVIESKDSPWIFKPLASYCLYTPRDVPGYQCKGKWESYVHPEGALYYLFKQDVCCYSFLTEADLTKETVLREVETFMINLQERIEIFPWEGRRPENMEVVLEIQGGLHYYMVDLDKQVVFWIDDFDYSPHLSKSYGIESINNLRGQLEFEYWTHIEHFPNHRDFRAEDFDEAIGILNFWRVDVTSSSSSTSPYEPSDIDSFARSIETLRGMVQLGVCRAYAVASVGEHPCMLFDSLLTTVTARVMSMVGTERGLNFYGSPGARIQVGQSVRGQKKERQWLVKYLSPLLFYAPDTHLSGIEEQWVDGVIQQRRWKKYQLKLEREWELFVLTSTVLLNANVALLATPIILAFDDGILFASPAAAASQVSIVASIASITIGLLLIRQIRISAKGVEITATDAIDYLSTRKHEQLGLETLAIQYSLPYALLMWSMVAFLTSIAIASFHNAEGWPTTPAKLLFACSWLFVIPLILWTAITGWETNNHAHLSELVSFGGLRSFISSHWGKGRKICIWQKPDDVESHGSNEVSDRT